MPWAPDYATAVELAEYLRIEDTADDVQLSLALSAASRAVDETCNRQFGSVASSARSYVPWWNSRRRLWVVDIDDMPDEPTSFTVDGAEVTPILWPVNAAAEGRPYTSAGFAARPSSESAAVVDVTASWGWSDVPETIKAATLIQASRFNFRRDSPAGVAGSPDQGAEVRLLARVDPDVAVMLRPYVRRATRVG